MNWQYTGGLVSVITPCYNTGSIVHRLLDSILMQDYDQIEMIVVNDGSTDNTEEVLISYKPLFEKRGFSLKYLFQPNSGQSSAINNGLKYVTGEYLTWPDSDDFFSSPNAISAIVQSFIDYPEYGVVRCLPNYVDENSLSLIRKLEYKEAYSLDNQFENCLFSKDFFWGAGDYFVRMSCFDRVNPEREIYIEKSAGQNWQMLMPVLYSYKCKTIVSDLFSVLVRLESHSRGQFKTYEQLYTKIASFSNTILATLDSISSMPENKREAYKRNIQKKYKLQELDLAFEYKKSEEKKRIIDELDSMNAPVSLIYKYMLWLKHTMIGKSLSRFHNVLHGLNHSL